MRRFSCPDCGRDLVEGTAKCPHCGAETTKVAAPPSPGERFPEVEFGSHELAEEFADLINASRDDHDPVPRFISLLQFAPWGSPWMEDYLAALEAGEVPLPPNIDLGALTLRDHLSRKERQRIRHYLPKVQAIPQNVQTAFVECLELTQWTPLETLSANAQQWVKTLVRSGVLERDPSEEERLSACSEDDLRELLQRHGGSSEGGRHELVGRVFDLLKPSEWQSFARAKLPGRLVRCKLAVAPELLKYLRVRHTRIRLLVTSILHRERTARMAAQWVSEGVNDDAFTSAGRSLPPFHPGCRCRLEKREVGELTVLTAIGEADACADCVAIAEAVGDAALTLTQPGHPEEPAGAEEDTAFTDYYADREWPWRCGMCPRCKDTMYKARRGGLIFHACSECQGIWLPWRLHSELFEENPDLVGRLDTDFTYYRHEPGQPAATQRCPDCETLELQDFYFEVEHEGQRHKTDVLTHRCPQCRGVWFDHAELHLISKAKAKLAQP